MSVSLERVAARQREVFDGPLAADDASAEPPLAATLRAFAQHRGAVVGLVVCVVVAVLAVLAPWIAPHDPIMQYADALLAPPVWANAGSWRFPLGTDELGRDMLSRLLHGARLSLSIGAVSVVIALVPGVALGLLAAARPRIIGSAILRTMDLLFTLPGVLLAIAFVVVLGASLLTTMIALGVAGIPTFARLTRASAASELSKDYVAASRLTGTPEWRMLLLGVLPNCLAPVIVSATLGFSDAILSAAGLGFLGLGAQPPAPEWGAMLATARGSLEIAPWVVTAPGLAILVTVLAMNQVGDGLRDALDPKLR